MGFSYHTKDFSINQGGVLVNENDHSYIKDCLNLTHISCKNDGIRVNSNIPVKWVHKFKKLNLPKNIVISFIYDDKVNIYC